MISLLLLVICKSNSASHAFVLMATQTSPESRDMNILVDVNHFSFKTRKNVERFEQTINTLRTLVLQPSN